MVLLEVIIIDGRQNEGRRSKGLSEHLQPSIFRHMCTSGLPLHQGQVAIFSDSDICPNLTRRVCMKKIQDGFTMVNFEHFRDGDSGIIQIWNVSRSNILLVSGPSGSQEKKPEVSLEASFVFILTI